jgi:hypothetical protein
VTNLTKERNDNTDHDHEEDEEQLGAESLENVGGMMLKHHGSKQRNQKTEVLNQSGKLALFMKGMLEWEKDSNVTIYLFFIGIVVLSAAVLAHETFVVDTAMVIGDNFHPSELGTLSVTYTVFYHFLFIVTGYGLRAVMGRNVLFLDVYRMALASALMVLVGYNVSILLNLPSVRSGKLFRPICVIILLDFYLILLLLFLCFK